ncbi:hypothetical protein AMECASPLE_003244 [Ameca splendens]|uniref:Uncharacterized protein n=1 Tax=Ameca splendens TaxID=208324 RepID=A0ABV0XYD9_9TELE
MECIAGSGCLTFYSLTIKPRQTDSITTCQQRCWPSHNNRVTPVLVNKDPSIPGQSSLMPHQLGYLSAVCFVIRHQHGFQHIRHIICSMEVDKRTNL